MKETQENEMCDGSDLAATVTARTRALAAEQAVAHATTFAVGAFAPLAEQTTEAAISMCESITVLRSLLWREAGVPAVRAFVCRVEESHNQDSFHKELPMRQSNALLSMSVLIL